MARAEQNLVPVARRVLTRRALPFALLFLALLGYAGLPSVPVNGLHVVSALSQQLQANSSPAHKFNAPQQEQEYRERDVDVIAASVEVDDDHGIASDAPLAIFPAVIKPGRAPPPATSFLATVRSVTQARAPPASTLV